MNIDLKLFLRIVLLLGTLGIKGPTTALAAGNGDCASLGLEAASSYWCKEVMDILNDPSSCAGEALKNMEGKPIPKSEEICPGSSGGIAKEQWQAIILSMVQVESGGNCSATGDSGGKSVGLLQTTSGDSTKGNPKSNKECSGDQTECRRGLKCGMCLALDNVRQSNKLFEEKEGLGTMFGPWRSKNASYQKQLDLAKKACQNAKVEPKSDSKPQPQPQSPSPAPQRPIAGNGTDRGSPSTGSSTSSPSGSSPSSASGPGSVAGGSGLPFQYPTNSYVPQNYLPGKPPITRPYAPAIVKKTPVAKTPVKTGAKTASQVAARSRR